MIDVNKFENRIVNFKRISAGVETVKEAEIRRIDYDQLAGVPRSVTARFTEPLNAIMTLQYDINLKKFRAPLGPDILESDFDINDFLKSTALGSIDNVIKSPKRNRPKF
jgi:hypothetical protein